MVSWTPTPDLDEWAPLDATHLSNAVGCSGLRGYKFKECTTDADCNGGNGQPTAMACSTECMFGDCNDGMEHYERAVAASYAEEEHTEFCRRECDEAGFCCNDWTAGANQLISCAQACMIRQRGTPSDECNDKCTAREANRMCQTMVNGFSYASFGTRNVELISHSLLLF